MNVTLVCIEGGEQSKAPAMKDQDVSGQVMVDKASQELEQVKSKILAFKKKVSDLEAEEQRLTIFIDMLHKFDPTIPSREEAGKMRSRTSGKIVPPPGTKRARVNDQVLMYLDLIAEYADTNMLVSHIQKHDATAYGYLGSNPAGTLSSYLSRDPRVKFERGNGWTLSSGDDEAADPLEGMAASSSDHSKGDDDETAIV